MKEYDEFIRIESCPESDRNLEDIKPLLDDAISKLRPQDRDVVVLHFLEGLSYRDIGQRLDKTPAATQRQASRAFAKLATLLKRKGATISAAALASGAPSLASALPSPEFAATVAAAATSTASKLGTLPLLIKSLMTMTKTKLAVAAVIIAMVPMSLKWWHGRDAETERPEKRPLRSQGETKRTAPTPGNESHGANGVDRMIASPKTPNERLLSFLTNESLPALESAIEQHPDDELFAILGAVWLPGHNDRLAAECLSRVRKADPENTLGLILELETLGRSGESSWDSLEEMEQTSFLSVSSEAFNDRLFETLLSAGENEDDARLKTVVASQKVITKSARKVEQVTRSLMEQIDSFQEVDIGDWNSETRARMGAAVRVAQHLFDHKDGSFQLSSAGASLERKVLKLYHTEDVYDEDAGTSVGARIIELMEFQEFYSNDIGIIGVFYNASSPQQKNEYVRLAYERGRVEAWKWLKKASR